MRKAIRQIAVCVAGLIVFCVICRLTVFRDFTLAIPATGVMHEGDGELRVWTEEGDAVRLEPGRREKGFLLVPVRPEKPGSVTVCYGTAPEETYSIHPLRVDRFHTVYDVASGNFTGDTAVLIAVTLFWLLVSAIMLWHFSLARGAAFYAYSTIYYAGFSLFALVNGLLMLEVTIRHIAEPDYYMMTAYAAINGASTQFALITTPLVLAFSIALAVSNLVLLRHERPRLQNALGLIISVALIAGETLIWWLTWQEFAGSEWEWRLRSTAVNVYATAFVYFECMLMGSVICGLGAAKHEPARDKDFILILGCYFRPDGTLPPLLRGRVDRAIAFWRRQRAETGLEAQFIPSGGQGPDETMPEAEAMHRYLRSQDIPEELIHPECRSRNTLENMTFSGELARQLKPEGRIAFSTTNYHVFRSGLLSQQAGLAAEGMGSRTKWWFWPNAFMRECIGLLTRRWWQELLFLVILMGFFGLLSMILW